MVGMPGSEPAARTCRSHLPGPRVQQLVTLQESGPKGASDGPQRSRILSGKTDSPHVGHLNARVSVCFRFSFLTLRSTEWETMFPSRVAGVCALEKQASIWSTAVSPGELS